MPTGEPACSIDCAQHGYSDCAPEVVISSLWIGQLTPLEQLCIRSFVAHGHPYHLYTYDEIENVPPGVTIQDASQILPRSTIFRNRRGKGKGSLAGFRTYFDTSFY